MTEDKFDDEQLIKVSRFIMSKALYTLSLFYRETSQELFRYNSPMNHVEEGIYEDIKAMMPSLDLFYADFKTMKHPTGTQIVIFEGNHTRIVILFKPGSINDLLDRFLKRIMEDFLFDFEDKYRKILKVYDGNVSVFKETDNMVKTSLNVELNLPHISKYRGFEPDDPIEKYIFEAGNEFSRKVGYFYLENLIYLTKEHVRDVAREMSIPSMDKKEKKKKVEAPENIKFPSELEFYVAMLNLRKLGMLESFPIEDLDAISKIKY